MRTSREPPRDRIIIFLVVAALLAALFAAVAVGWSVIADQRARDLAAWQGRLELVADNESAAVAGWVERQYGALAALADNPSVQLYLGELAAAEGDRAKVTDEAAQQSYLRNLLVVSAQRDGFAAPPAGPQVDANLPRQGLAGLVILDAAKHPLAATPETPPPAGRLAEFLGGAPRGERALLDIFAAPDGAPTMAFLVPVFSVEGGHDAAQQLGYVLGVKPVAGELFALLRPPGPAESGADALLVRPAGAAVEYLSPLADGTPALRKHLARDTPDLAEAFAMSQPGGFAVKRDYRDRLVLAVGRAVPGTPWTLVSEIDRDRALGESDRRVTRLAVIAGLALAVIAGGFLAVWHYAGSRRAQRAAAEYRSLAERYAGQGALLRLVTDSQPTAIVMLDGAGRYRFANRQAAARAGLAESDLVGKTLEQVLGPAAAARILRLNEEALAAGGPVAGIDRIEEAGGHRVVQSSHVPLPEGPELAGGVLVVEQDVTELTAERERRETTLRQLVGAMAAAVDRRDRHAADQSSRVARLARAIAGEMDLEPALAETAEIAGTLMNFGKLLVPPELLTRTTPLAPEEVAQIRAAIQTTADIVASVAFAGPVVETLRQIYERWDGSGPRGLRGEAILPTARILAVANAFVAMASPRAWRPGGDIDGALDELFAKAGSLFDRRVVAALVAHLDMRGGRASWLAPAVPAAGA